MQTFDIMSDPTFDSRLAQIDFGPLLSAVIADPDLAWDREFALTTLELYKNFLFLAYKYPGEQLTVPASVDRMWHHHILNTKKYFCDCDALFGEYLHHTPSPNNDGEARDRVAETYALWIDNFGPKSRLKLDTAFRKTSHCISTRAA